VAETRKPSARYASSRSGIRCPDASRRCEDLRPDHQAPAIHPRSAGRSDYLTAVAGGWPLSVLTGGGPDIPHEILTGLLRSTKAGGLRQGELCQLGRIHLTQRLSPNSR
jgi:hypothetical protein